MHVKCVKKKLDIQKSNWTNDQKNFGLWILPDCRWKLFVEKVKFRRSYTFRSTFRKMNFHEFEEINVKSWIGIVLHWLALFKSYYSGIKIKVFNTRELVQRIHGWLNQVEMKHVGRYFYFFLFLLLLFVFFFIMLLFLNWLIFFSFFHLCHLITLLCFKLFILFLF